MFEFAFNLYYSFHADLDIQQHNSDAVSNLVDKHFKIRKKSYLPIGPKGPQSSTLSVVIHLSRLKPGGNQSSKFAIDAGPVTLTS